MPLARRQDYRCHVQDSREWKEGIIEEAEGNQTNAAEVEEPPPHTARRHWQQRRDYMTGNHRHL
jgi:hypothetical protein